MVIAVQSLYDDVNDMLNDADAHQMFGSLSSSNVYDRMRLPAALNPLLVRPARGAVDQFQKLGSVS
jgi:hypothetical protein